MHRDKDCMKMFYEFLREHSLKIINSKKKELRLLTTEQQESMKMLKSVMFVKKNLKINI